MENQETALRVLIEKYKDNEDKYWVTCGECDGFGFVINPKTEEAELCYMCNGEGRVY